VTKVAVIGTQGMLGHTVCRYLAEKNYQIIEITSSGKSQSSNPVTQYDIVLNEIEMLESYLKPVDFVINCAGIIKHKIDENSKESLNNLIRVNSLFPLQLTKLSHELNFKVIQIATDCVYSGAKGNYSESDNKDPIDHYGFSKVLGEHYDSNLITLRCSIVGREQNSRIAFLEWVLSHGKDISVNGYTDHLWNGLTTLHFAKIVEGIIKGSNFRSGTFHLVPSDSLSKFELAKVILGSFGTIEAKITKSKSSKAINRILTTNYQEFNNDMWLSAGYNRPLSISEMVKEYALWA
jgi:dTDP-4-dehydrorhamnose reductase